MLVENTLLNLKESLMVSDNSSFSVFPFHMLWFCSVYSTEFYLSLMWCSSFYSALLVFNFILKTKKRKLCNNLSTSLTVAVTTLFVDFGVFAQESVCVWAGFDFFYMVLDRKCEEMLIFYSKWPKLAFIRSKVDRVITLYLLLQLIFSCINTKTGH